MGNENDYHWLNLTEENALLEWTPKDEADFQAMLVRCETEWQAWLQFPEYAQMVAESDAFFASIQSPEAQAEWQELLATFEQKWAEWIASPEYAQMMLEGDRALPSFSNSDANESIDAFNGFSC